MTRSLAQPDGHPPVNRPARRLYKFLLWAALIYAVFTPIWWQLVPVYSRVLAAVANVTIRSVPFDSDVRIFKFEGGSMRGRIEFTVPTKSRPEGRPLAAGVAWSARIFQFSFAIWTALILATPFTKWKKKAAYFLLGSVIVLGGQLVDMYWQAAYGKLEALRILQASGEYTLGQSEEYLLTWSHVFSLRIWKDLLPIVLWLLLGLPQFRASTSSRPFVPR